MHSPAQALRPSRRLSRSGTADARGAVADAISVQDFEITQEVQPGARVALSFNVLTEENPWSGIPGLDPDFCVAQNFEDGVKLTLEIRLNGGLLERRDVCWPETSSTRIASFDFIAPTAIGNHGVEAIVRRQSDGAVVASHSTTITVLEDAVDGACPAGFERDPVTGECVPIDGGNGGNGDDGGGAGGFLEQAQGLLLLLVVLVGIAAASG